MPVASVPDTTLPMEIQYTQKIQKAIGSKKIKIKRYTVYKYIFSIIQYFRGIRPVHEPVKIIQILSTILCGGIRPVHVSVNT